MLASQQDVLSHFPGYKKEGSGWKALCPVHGDKTPSLSISCPNGKWLFICRTHGCAFQDIVRAAGLDGVDLGTLKSDNASTDVAPAIRPISGKDTARYTLDDIHRGVPWRGSKMTVDAIYPYEHRTGGLFYLVARLLTGAQKHGKPEKTFRQFRRVDEKQWVMNMDGIKPVLYHLPALLRAEAAAEIVCTGEGERCVEALESIGLVATTNVGGAGKWKPEYTQDLKRFKMVAIFPDNDEPGSKHAQAVAESCSAAGIPVKVVEFPDLPEKGDVVDWLAQGHTKDELLALVEQAPWWTSPDNLPADRPAGTPAEYEERDGCLYWNRTDQTGSRVLIQLANFTARIVAQTEELNGVESRRTYEIEATHRGQLRRIRVPAEAFATLRWKESHLSATAFVRPGQGTMDRTSHAIRTLSGEIPEKQIYTCTGWIQRNGQWVYLTEASAIGAQGPTADVEVVLPEKFKTYSLPTPPASSELKAAVEASLSFLEVAPHTTTFPILGSIFRSVLGDAGYTLWVSGRPTVGKTALTLVALQHFGAGFTGRTVPEDWCSTVTALMTASFMIKDACLMIDDYAPQGSSRENENQRAKVHKLVRAQGNGSSRGRCNVDGSLQDAHPPRGLIVSTGEDEPGGDSIMARILLVEIRKGDVELSRLTKIQQLGGQGILAQSMAGFIQWLANHPEWLGAQRTAREFELRERFAGGGQNGRSPGNLAAAFLGFEVFIGFATAVQAITAERAVELLRQAGLAMQQAAATQAEQSKDMDPARRYLTAIASALSTGEAYLESPEGGAPENWSSLGWRADAVNSELKLPSGKRVGWVDQDGVYLEPSAAYLVANERTTRQGMPLGVGQKTAHKRLDEGGHLIRAGGTRQTLTARKVIARQRIEVLHVKTTSLFLESDEAIEAVGRKRTDHRADFPGTGDHAKLSSDEDFMRNGQVGQVFSPPTHIHLRAEGVTDDDVA